MQTLLAVGDYFRHKGQPVKVRDAEEPVLLWLTEQSTGRKEGKLFEFGAGGRIRHTEAPMPKKSRKIKPPKKKVKRQPKPKRQPDLEPAPGILTEGIPIVPQPASMPSGLPEKVGHWGHEHDKE